MEAGKAQAKHFAADRLEACRDIEALVSSEPGFLAVYHGAEKPLLPSLPAYLVPAHPSRHVPNALFPRARHRRRAPDPPVAPATLDQLFTYHAGHATFPRQVTGSGSCWN